MTPMTDAEYREWDRAATRPYTDKPLGGATAGRRNRDARLSALMHGHEKPRYRMYREVRSPWTGRRYTVRC